LITLRELNESDRAAFCRACGPLFEHSPWIAERTFDRRPFASLDELHGELCRAVRAATRDEQVRLIAAHPDLVGRLAREGRLTRESRREQSAAGLTRLSADEVAAFERYNAEYRAKFGFAFVICARENTKDAILAAFPLRLKNSREQEIETALGEIAKIARLRLLDAVREG
jgi:OHCU decarboxylase